jgi:primase-polymerase (primpol)-like protein
LHKFDGLGFMLGDGFCGIDLDNCRDPLSGQINEQDLAIIQELNSYTEISPRSCGLKVLVKATKPAGRCRIGNVEIYSQARFFTITGHHLAGTPATVEERQDAVNRLHARLFPINSTPAANPAGRYLLPTDDDLPDAEILDLAKKAANGEKFAKLWAGDWQSLAYPSQSEADQALVGILAFWTGPNAERIDRLFRRSGLYRDKWERQHYRDRTIQRVLDTQQEFFNWHDPEFNNFSSSQFRAVGVQLI